MDTTTQLTPKTFDAKRIKCIRLFYGKTLADEAQEVIDLLGEAKQLSEHAQLLLRFAQEILAAKIIALPECPKRK